MANSSVVGILKVLLTANTAEFDTAMKGVGKDLDKLGSQAGGVSSLIGKIGPALVGAFTVGAIAKVTGDFVGDGRRADRPRGKNRPQRHARCSG